MKAHKKTGFKKNAQHGLRRLYVLLIVAAAISAVAVIFLVLLFHKPSSYKPLDFSGSREVSLYLTHQLLPDFYNGIQLQEPFELVVAEDGINDAVAHFKWPRQLGGVGFSAPMVFFADDAVVLMGTVSTDGTELVITITAHPALDAEGLLNLNVAGVKIGAVDISPLAAVLAKKISDAKYAAQPVDENDFRTKMTMAILNGEPFDPVFKVEDKKVRIEKISLEQKKLTIRFTPVLN
ncbi:MAG: hypothetical protein JW947_09330 [Sedimentisphaerales bacterium]|nr:hypothetical protein [Sedimentisphaerales bacterium]